MTTRHVTISVDDDDVAKCLDDDMDDDDEDDELLLPTVDNTTPLTIPNRLAISI
jgi:hypothetical protein